MDETLEFFEIGPGVGLGNLKIATLVLGELFLNVGQSCLIVQGYGQNLAGRAIQQVMIGLVGIVKGPSYGGAIGFYHGNNIRATALVQ